jgi:hypothetical protein
VTPSPEPISNIALSMGEDGVAVGLTWFATRHPFIGASIAAALLVAAVILASVLWQALRRVWTGLFKTRARERMDDDRAVRAEAFRE